MVIDRVAGGLHDKDVLAADGLRHGNGALAVGELGNGGIAELGVKLAADLFGQLGVGIAAEHFDFFAVCDHLFSPHIIYSPPLFPARREGIIIQNKFTILLP
jgi:hypothetical protein